MFLFKKRSYFSCFENMKVIFVIFGNILTFCNKDNQNILDRLIMVPVQLIEPIKG